MFENFAKFSKVESQQQLESVCGLWDSFLGACITLGVWSGVQCRLQRDCSFNSLGCLVWTQFQACATPISVERLRYACAGFVCRNECPTVIQWKDGLALSQAPDWLTCPQPMCVFCGESVVSISPRAGPELNCTCLAGRRSLLVFPCACALCVANIWLILPVAYACLKD